jgi:hypothetical protein
MVALYPTGRFIPTSFMHLCRPNAGTLPGTRYPGAISMRLARETFVITTEPGWRKLLGTGNYVVAEERRFGERIKVIRLRRAHE